MGINKWDWKVQESARVVDEHDVKVVLEDSNVLAKHFPPGITPKYALE